MRKQTDKKPAPPAPTKPAAPVKKKAAPKRTASKKRPQRKPPAQAKPAAAPAGTPNKQLTISQLAMEYDLNRATVSARLTKAGAKPIIDGTRERRFEVTEEIDALLKGLESEAIEAAKLRKLMSEADLKEFQVMEKRGEMLSTDDVKAAVIGIFSTLQKEIVDQVPRKLAPKLKKGGSVAVISAVLKQALEEPFNSLRIDYKKFLHE